VDRRRLVRIYNGVDSTKFSPPSPENKAGKRRRLGIADDAFVVGMVAGFRPEKNHDILFLGAEKAMATIPGLRLLVVGAGPLLEHFRQMYAARIAEGRIILTGESDNVVPYLEAMDVGCLIPGKNEGFSNSVIEKMAVGLPMIVSDVGGNPEAVIDGENGFVIPPNDPDALRVALEKMDGDPALRGAMGRRSRQLVEERYSLQEMCLNHEALYCSLLDRR
jgi:glycosyltransferase involved in cell wall biosynthesis